MNKLIPIVVAFQAIPLAGYMVRGSIGWVIMFGCASAVFGFLCWLDRVKLDQAEELKAELKALHSEISNINVRLGW